MSFLELHISVLPQRSTAEKWTLSSVFGPTDNPVRNQSTHNCDIARYKKCSAEILRLLTSRTNDGPDPNLPGRLRIQGIQLYDLLVSDKVRESLQAVQPEGLIIYADSHLIAASWDLIYDGNDFWGLKYAMGRIGVTEQAVRANVTHGGGGPFILANPTGDLPGATKEGEALRKELLKHPNKLDRPDLKPRLLCKDASDLFRTRKMLFFLGHAMYDAGDPETGCGWILSDGLFTPAAMARLHSIPEIIFANACHSGATSPWMNPDQLYGMANAAVLNGCKGYIGALTRIPDEQSMLLSTTFVKELAAQATTGEALQRARRAVAAKDHKDILWAYSTLYGNPTYQMIKPPPPPERCGACQRQGVGENWVSGFCDEPGCDEPLCTLCTAQRKTKCRTHAQQEGPTPESCSLCQRVITDSRETGRQTCQTNGCDTPICGDCQPTAYCKAHLPDQIARIADPLHQKATAFVSHVLAALRSRTSAPMPSGSVPRKPDLQVTEVELSVANTIPLGCRNIIPHKLPCLKVTNGPETQVELFIVAAMSPTQWIAGESKPLAWSDADAIRQTIAAGSDKTAWVILYSPAGWVNPLGTVPSEVALIQHFGTHEGMYMQAKAETDEHWKPTLDALALTRVFPSEPKKPGNTERNPRALNLTLQNGKGSNTMANPLTRLIEWLKGLFGNTPALKTTADVEKYRVELAEKIKTIEMAQSFKNAVLERAKGHDREHIETDIAIFEKTKENLAFAYKQLAEGLKRAIALEGAELANECMALCTLGEERIAAVAVALEKAAETVAIERAGVRQLEDIKAGIAQTSQPVESSGEVTAAPITTSQSEQTTQEQSEEQSEELNA